MNKCSALEKKLLSKYSKEERAEITYAIADILKYLYNCYYYTPIEYVDILEREDFYIFTPYTKFKTLLNENISSNDNFLKVDISKFIGYSLLSTSSLTRYIIDKQFTERKEDNIIYFKTPLGYISLISLFNIPLSNTSDLTTQIEWKINSLIKEGYFAYNFSIHDLEDLELVRELCLSYDIRIVDDKDLSTLICKTNVDFKTTPEEWMRYNLVRIKSGLFPTFTISYDFSFFNDYIRLYGEQFKDVILKYVTYLSFAKVSDSHPVISSSITSININEDLSITVALPTYSLVLLLKKYITEYLNNGISYSKEKENKLNGAWNMEVCKNLREGILKRWKIQQIDPDSYPMIFKDKTGNELIINRSPLFIGRENFKKEGEKINEESLLLEMKKFYIENKTCHDDMEPVTLENINDMSLDELLNLIPVEEKGKTYCFSDSTINSLVKKENPLTRRPLSEYALLTQKYLEDGLRGLFDVGVLFGLYEKVPIRHNVDVNIGIIKVTRERESVDSKRRELVGNVYLVEVIFEDGTTSPLFEISLPTVELERVGFLREYVNNLWTKGYFLSPWVASNYIYLNLKSFPILIQSFVLLHAADSIYDGNIAFEMLRNATL